MAIYLGFLLLVTLSPILLAINMNRRRIRLLGLYAPIVFTLCMLKVLESNISDPEYGSLEAFILMILYGFPLIIGALVYTLIRLCFVYRKNLRKGFLIFLSYIFAPLLVGALGLSVVMLFQIHQLMFVVLILMILVSYLPAIFLIISQNRRKV